MQLPIFVVLYFVLLTGHIHISLCVCMWHVRACVGRCLHMEGNCDPHCYMCEFRQEIEIIAAYALREGRRCATTFKKMTKQLNSYGNGEFNCLNKFVVYVEYLHIYIHRHFLRIFHYFA